VVCGRKTYHHEGCNLQGSVVDRCGILSALTVLEVGGVVIPVGFHPKVLCYVKVIVHDSDAQETSDHIPRLHYCQMALAALHHLCLAFQYGDVCVLGLFLVLESPEILTLSISFCKLLRVCQARHC
jgi:hypothetical protein